jgi:ABC-type transport system involved in multi-copper enzyme maturation permease subunit
MVTELEEEHSHSYELLTSLPLRLREIVAAKFLLFLAAVAALTAQQFAFLKLVQAAPAPVAIAQAAVLACGAACLVIGGIAQASIFSLGYARFTVLSLVALTAFSLVPPLLLAMGGTAAREAVRQTAGLLLALNPAAIVLAGLALYALLFLVSVALFRREARLS